MFTFSTPSPTAQSAPKVSICLPTCNRPELIAECIDSCLAQTYGDLEIVIGDDSKDGRTQQLIAQRYPNEPRIRYVMNQPPLGQARNVASLFERARGDKILLIHDDDLLTTDGIEKLVSLWALHPRLEVAFANQYEADHNGIVDLDASMRLNIAFHRTRDAEGLQPLPGRTGLIQMFPNNGWMANADLVKRIGYTDQYGTCCDFVFGTELCLAAREVFYLHEYVSVYRKTATSISHSTRGTTSSAPVSAYAFVKTLRLPPQLEPSRKLALRRLAPIVVSVHAKNQQVAPGLKILFTHLFAYNYGLSMRFCYHLLMLSRAAVNLRQHAAVTSVAAAASGVAAAASGVAAAASAVVAEPGTAVAELVTDIVTDRSELI
ncbi:glycosyltransferase like 2 family protein [Paraburkholderia fungorum]|uniref:Glycosyltransferase like 2 family protein n=1 Tax=Paraburkholderia fungorum TaxID=134537 RepID=A0AAU8TD27_9BURK|nr:glycosyltransferase family 2 protein [Paraburkholderia fungorum]AJZ59468.1 glycosyltransferase like 2 family protein [Paraburkholderia fungorum]USU14289.1 glycosyltransferase [Paraburkholderia fungorum]USU22237.1 glycosyltransferase [Paraburkholderia fungorum]